MAQKQIGWQKPGAAQQTGGYKRTTFHQEALTREETSKCEVDVTFVKQTHGTILRKQTQTLPFVLSSTAAAPDIWDTNKTHETQHKPTSINQNVKRQAKQTEYLAVKAGNYSKKQKRYTTINDIL